MKKQQYFFTIFVLSIVTLTYSQKYKELLPSYVNEVVDINTEDLGTIILLDEGLRLLVNQNQYNLFFYSESLDFGNIHLLERRYWGEDIIGHGVYPDGKISFRTIGGGLDYKEGKIHVIKASKEEFVFSVDGTVITRDNKRYDIDAKEIHVRIKAIQDNRTLKKKMRLLRSLRENNQGLVEM